MPVDRKRPRVEAPKIISDSSACRSCSSIEIKTMGTPSGKRLVVCGSCGLQYTLNKKE